MKLRRITPDLLEDSLKITPEAAQSVQQQLVTEGWIEPDRFAPTRKGMALAQHIDRPRLSRAEAEMIVERVLDWADQINADADARVKLKAIYLYGSLERGEAQVGDIDLFVDFTTMDLREDLHPEDFARQAEISEGLVSISEYLSPSSEIDRRMMSDVKSRKIFPRSSTRHK